MEFRCQHCGNTFQRNIYLYRHQRRIHGPSHRCFQCYHCNFKTKFKSALKRHVVIKHIKKPKESKSPIHICVLCHHFESEIREEITQHYVDNHEVPITQKLVTFKKFEDFEVWKSNVEKVDVRKFIAPYGAKIRKTVQVKYYRCSRDGVFYSKGSKRHLKVKGSIKIGGICPASMKVVTEKETGLVKVFFIPNHVGHGQELGRLNLTKGERAEIAHQIALNIPYQAILDRIRTSKRDELQRIHLTTRKDIWNIQASFKLGKVDRGFLHTNDRTSMEAWIRLMEQETNMVRFYKPQGVVLPSHPQLLEDDMVLMIASDAQLEMLKKYGSDCICFEGTHGLNPYEFELTTVLVLDKFRQGFPCSFMFSSRSDSEVMSLFVSILKVTVGDIQPKVFMTDMSLIYINGWKTCMSEPTNTLFCNWHVDRAWRKNLAKVKSSDKKKEVYLILRTLMEETDKTAFLQLVGKATQKFESDPTTSDFGKYFKET